MKIYTKAGDKGQTTLAGCKINKNSPEADAVGTLDELNAQLGVARCAAKDESSLALLLTIQNDLFILGAELHGAKNQKITEGHVQLVEEFIDANQEVIPNYFILPGGSLGSAQLHVARAVCRRAERNLVAVKPDSTVLRYINRLSDCLFVMALKENHVHQVKEIPFKN